MAPYDVPVWTCFFGCRCNWSAAEWKTIVPAQTASNCCTTSGCAKNRFAWALMAISMVEIRAWTLKRGKTGVEFPVRYVGRP